MQQASLRRNPAPDPRRDPTIVGGGLGDFTYEVGQKGLFLGRAYYGCVATVLPSVSPGLSRKVSMHTPFMHLYSLPQFAGWGMGQEGVL